MDRAFSLPKLSAIAIIVCFSLLFGLITSSWAGLANSPWPMRGHDPQHTGRSPYVGPSTSNNTRSRGLGSYPVISSPAINSDGTVYITARDDLFAINPDDSIKWRYPIGGATWSSPAISSDGTVYVGSYDGKLYAVNSDGTLKWSYNTEGAIISSPAIAPDGTIYIGSNNKKVTAINPNGTLKWTYRTGGEVKASPAIGYNGTVYVGSSDEGILRAFNQDGVLNWYYIPPVSWIIKSITSIAIGPNGTIYFGLIAHTNDVYAISNNGIREWDYPVRGIPLPCCWFRWNSVCRFN